MQNPRGARPQDGGRSGERDLPYDPADWSRRLDEARERRARVLAARKHQPDGAAPPELQVMREPEPLRLRAEARAPASDSEVLRAESLAGARSAGTRRGGMGRIGLVFAAGVAVGLLAMLLAEDGSPPEVAGRDGTNAIGEAVGAGESAAVAEVGLAEDAAPDRLQDQAAVEAVADSAAAEAGPDVAAVAPDAASEPERAVLDEPAPAQSPVAARDDEPAIARSLPPAAEDARLFVHASPAVDGPTFDAVASRLSAAGYALAERLQVGFPVADTHVRYFFDADAEVAADVAARVGGRARDFTSYRPSPQAGTIEVWIGG